MKRTIKALLITLLCLASTLQGIAQRFPDESDQFIKKLDEFMSESPKAATQDALGSFKILWESGQFNAVQQKNIIEFSQKMAAKRFNRDAAMTHFYNTIVSAINIQKIDETKLNELLAFCLQVIDKNTSRESILFLDRLNSFFEKKALYDSNFNKVFITADNYQFIFINDKVIQDHSWFKDWQQPEKEENYDEKGNIIQQDYPDLGGAGILFSNAALTFVTPYDSVNLRKTKGVYLLKDDFFIGNKGLFDWSDISIADSLKKNKPNIFAEFITYGFKLSSQHIKAQHVKLIHSTYLKEPIQGDFEYFSKKRKREDLAEYPVFRSYSSDISIPDLGKNIYYKGGFSLRGRIIYGASAFDSQGVIQVKEGASKIFSIHSKTFRITEENISAPDASFVFYYGDKDSLSHERISFTYNKVDEKNFKIKFFKPNENKDIPFIDHFHKIYITADLAEYNHNAQLLDFYVLGATDKIPALFESYNYFSDERYRGLQGLYKFHPLSMVTGYANENGNTFRIDDLSAKYNINISAVKGALDVLSRQGYISFDESSGEVTVLNRATHMSACLAYIKAIKIKNRGENVPPSLEEYLGYDYDDLLIQSLAPRDAKNDSIAVDSVQFSLEDDNFSWRKILNKELVITKRVFESEEVSFDEDGAALSQTINETIDTPEYFKDFDPKKLDSTYTAAKSLEGYYYNKTLIKGDKMPNATINKVDGGITIRGIDQFPISKKLNVNVIPRNHEVTIYQDRMIAVDHGEVTIGNYRFIGKDFKISYQDFRADIAQIDTMLFYLPDKNDSTQLIPIGAEIRLSSGHIKFSYPNNISGLKEGYVTDEKKDAYEAYPKLEVEEGGNIYFNQPYRQKGAYDSAMVYFEIPDIKIDSLTQILPDFKGIFHSNIFPDFTEHLTPMPDNSLGFTHLSTQEYPLYSSSATLQADTIVMDKSGLFTKGLSKIQHYTTTLKATKFIFTCDSLFSQNVSAEIIKGDSKGAHFPQAKGAHLRLSWLTQLRDDKGISKVDSMKLYSTDQLFTLYEAENPISLEGSLCVTPNGLWADGTLNRKDFQVYSSLMKMNPDSFFARESQYFKINSTEKEIYSNENDFDFYANNPPLIEANFIDINFELTQHKATIKPLLYIAEDDPHFTFIKFPKAQFTTSISSAIWDLKQKKVQLSGDTSSIFISYKFGEEEGTPEKDIRLYATKGVYDIADIENPELRLEHVPEIISVDAKIIPLDGKVTILKSADLQKLDQAKLIIDTLNGYHNLFDGTIKINHRLDFEGNATYQFVNIDKDTFNIKFDQFEFIKEEIPHDPKDKDAEVVYKTYTVSSGNVEENDQFYITSNILYKGKVTMFADRENLELEGFIKLNLKNSKDNDYWFPYERDAGDVLVELKERTKAEDRILTSGLHFDPTNATLYTTFIQEKKKDADIDLLLSSGILSYDPSTGAFIITKEPEQKSKNDKKIKAEFSAEKFLYNDEKNQIEIDAKVNFAGQGVNSYIITPVKAEIDLSKRTFHFHTYLSLDVKEPKSAFSYIADAVLANKTIETPVAREDTLDLLHQVGKLVEEQEIQEYYQELILGNSSPVFNIDKKLQNALVLYPVNWHWSAEHKTFYSTGKLGISHCYNEDINVAVDGFVELRKNIDGDILNIYLQISNDTWFFFSLQNDILSAVSSVDRFNSAFAKGKPQKKAGEYTYELLDESALIIFKNRLLDDYDIRIEDSYPINNTDEGNQKDDIIKSDEDDKEVKDNNEINNPEDKESDPEEDKKQEPDDTNDGF